MKHMRLRKLVAAENALEAPIRPTHIRGTQRLDTQQGMKEETGQQQHIYYARFCVAQSDCNRWKMFQPHNVSR